MKDNWVVVDETTGDLQPEILRGFLEAQGIPVFLSQESAAKAIGLTLPAIGTVHIMVPESLAAAARQLLKDYYAGKLTNLTLADDETGEDNLPDDAGAEGDQG